MKVNIETQSIELQFYNETENLQSRVFDCPFTKETLIRLTVEYKYKADSGVHNTNFFLLLDREII